MKLMTQEKCDEVLVALRRIVRGIDLHSKKLEQKYGVTGPQILILKEICRVGGVPISILARNANLSHATVTSILDRLEKKQYIVRERDTLDKRKIFAKATGKAHELFVSNPTLLQESFVNEFSTLEDWEQTQILSTLQRIAAMMDVKNLDASPLLASDELGDPVPST